jgi:V/A-type H+-transporting ATPase subunit E
MTTVAGQDSRLLDGIIAEAEAKATKIISEAEKDAGARLDAAKDKAEHERQIERKANALRLEQVRLKGESTKRNASRKATLRRMDVCYDVIMDRVREKLQALSETEAFQRILVDWVAEAAIGLDLPKAKVSGSPKAPVTEAMLRSAEKQVKALTGAEISLSLDARPTQSVGVVVSSLDGKVSYNNLVDVRLRRFDRDIKQLVEEGTCKAE